MPATGCLAEVCGSAVKDEACQYSNEVFSGSAKPERKCSAEVLLRIGAASDEMFSEML